MDLATILGLILGAMMLVTSIILTGASPMLYIDIGSIVLVVGGSFFAIMIGIPMTRALGIMKFTRNAFFIKNYEKEKLISTLVSFSEQARREGLLALEDSLDELEDKFLEKGLRLVVDGTDPTLIKSILYNDLNQMEARHEAGIKVWDEWSKSAPAFGMMGTVIGLIAMMASLGDQAAVGRGMALALITTLYGAAVSYLVCTPLKNKLQNRSGEEIMVREIMIEGVLSIQSGDNPRMVEEKLLAFLSPVERESIKAVSSAGE
ncbi:MAG: motility protein A [Spirochaetes bacterium]|nr:motility protein A [Spirochaetota bacterium]